MKPSQEFTFKTEKGTTFRTIITEVASNIYQWDYLEYAKDSVNSIHHGRRENPRPPNTPFEKPSSAFNDMVESIITYLNKSGDRIASSAAGNCELVSLESQERIIKKQSYTFPVKADK